MEFTVRPLAEDDWQDWKRIRLEALRLHPTAFGGDPEDESENNDALCRARLTRGNVFGAYVGGELVGTVGLSFYPLKKTKHGGNLFAVYLKDGFRGRGISDALIEAAIAHARTVVEQLHLHVVPQNTAAVKLYQKHGFRICGTEPRSLKVDGKYYDEHMMVLMLDGG